MEQLVVQFIDKLPVAAALIVMCWMWFRYMKTRDAEWNSTIKRMHEESLQCHHNCTEAVKESTQLIGKVSTLLSTRIKQVGGEQHG